ncbi:MAG: PKD domain-containing protein [Bacteroidales bacterium]|nr:PKD domain-containing protein [Bacteroidales bacterium]
MKKFFICGMVLFATLLILISTSCKKEELPILTTVSVSNITSNSADCGGDITFDGNTDILSRGVVWSESSNPTIENHDGISIDGTGTGIFNSTIVDLKHQTQYYVRAFASNSVGVSYGNEFSFTTDTIISIISIADFSASHTFIAAGGTVSFTDESTNNPTSWEWSFSGGTPSSSTQQNPSVTYNSTGIFTVGLIVTYDNMSDTLIRYDYINVGTSGLPCANMPTYTDSRDGTVYPTVQIGNQCWMAKNLAYLPNVVGPETGSLSTACYYVYGYDGISVTDAKAVDNYSTYGVLYNWSAAMGGQESSTTNPSGVQGVCPTGWHLPSDEEWKELEMVIGLTQEEADVMGWRGTNEGSKMATNASLWNDGLLVNNEDFGSSGFKALPGGRRYLNGVFEYVNVTGNYWSATETYSDHAYHRLLGYQQSNVYRIDYDKQLGISVRCLKD